MSYLPIAHRFKTVEQLLSWEEALYKATSQLIEKKVLSANYLKDIVEEVNRSGAYMAITHDTVLFHARPSDYIFKEFISYLKVDEGITYFDKTIHHVFVFGARTPDYHQILLRQISMFITETKSDPSLLELNTMTQWFLTKEKQTKR